MQFCRFLLILWVIVFVCFSGFPSPKLQADPTDDLSLTLTHSAELDLYSLVSERTVAEVFTDQLDLFPKSLAPKLAHHLVSLSKHYRFDPSFILSLIQVESHFHLKAISEAGAIGLMQIMPFTAHHIVEDWELPLPAGLNLHRALMDPFFNLTVGIAYLAELRDHYPGRGPYYLLAAYNLGPARMDELLARPGGFRPEATKKYYEAIRRGVNDFRYYQPLQTAESRSKIRKT